MTKQKNKTNVHLINKLNNRIIQNNYIKKNKYILISISGGQDSICLFFIFLQLKKQWNWSFGIIYCNHLWQKNSFYTILLIIKLAYIFKIPVYYTITPNKIFNEYKSRYWRYNTLYRISFFYNYTIITTGHTSSDKIETILFQFTRGTSTKSLTCLHPKKYFLSTNKFSQNITIQTNQIYYFKTSEPSKIYTIFHQNYFFLIFLKKNTKFTLFFLKNIKSWKNFIHEHKFSLRCIENSVIHESFLIRPMLSLNRFDVKKLIIFWKLPLYPDKTNEKKQYYRNRIRKQLLPTLRFFFNRQIDTVFLQFAEIATQEQIYLDFIVNRFFYNFQIKKLNRKVIPQGDYLLTDCFKLNNFLFYGIPLAIQRKLIKQFLLSYNCKKISFDQIEYIINSINQNKKLSKLLDNLYEPNFLLSNFLLFSYFIKWNSVQFSLQTSLLKNKKLFNLKQSLNLKKNSFNFKKLILKNKFSLIKEINQNGIGLKKNSSKKKKIFFFYIWNFPFDSKIVYTIISLPKCEILFIPKVGIKFNFISSCV